MQFNPVFYDWKKDYISSETKRQIGLIAEDVASITPEFVGYDSEGNPLNVDYPKITAVLINAVKELNEKVSNQISIASSQITNSFDGILDWLSDKVVKAKEFIADKITTKELCLEDVCINKEQLKALLEKTQTSSLPPPPLISEPPVPSEVEEEPTPEPPLESFNEDLTGQAEPVPELTPPAPEETPLESQPLSE
jgi:hypothetical protein